MKVSIVGGGLVGCALALALAKRGQDVTLFDAGLARGASPASGGMLGWRSEYSQAGEAFELARRAAKLWPAFAVQLGGAERLGWVAGGTQWLLDAEQRETFVQRLGWQRELGLSWEEQAGPTTGALNQERGLAGQQHATQSLTFKDELAVRPDLCLRACRQVAEANGVRILSSQVQALDLGEARCAGVVVAGGPQKADAVVLCAGAWSPGLLAGTLELPVRAMLGQAQILELPMDRAEHFAEAAPQVIRGKGFYLVPRGGREYYLGATEEEGVWTQHPNESLPTKEAGESGEAEAAGTAPALSSQAARQALKRLRASAEEALPGLLSDARVLETRVGLRPWSQDTRPIVGPSSIPGLHLCVGHTRNGVLLSPLSAELLSAMILEEAPALEAVAWSPRRFGL